MRGEAHLPADLTPKTLSTPQHELARQLKRRACTRGCEFALNSLLPIAWALAAWFPHQLPLLERVYPVAKGDFNGVACGRAGCGASSGICATYVGRKCCGVAFGARSVLCTHSAVTAKIACIGKISGRVLPRYEKDAGHTNWRHA